MGIEGYQPSPAEVKKAMNKMGPRERNESRDRERLMEFAAAQVAGMKEDGTLYEQYARQVLEMEKIKMSEERRRVAAAKNPNFMTMGDGYETSKIMMEMMERGLGPEAEKIRREMKEEGKQPDDYLTMDDLERLAIKYPDGGYAEDFKRKSQTK